MRFMARGVRGRETAKGIVVRLFLGVFLSKHLRHGFGFGMKIITAIAAFLFAALGAPAGPAYPLKISPGQHYLVDQSNTPFFIQGDSPWYLIQRLNTTDVDYYLSNRWIQGYNSIILDLQSHRDGSGNAWYPSADIYGNNPFTNTIAGSYTNFLAINPDYYANADYVIGRAAYYGMNVFLYPMYDGYQGGPV